MDQFLPSKVPQLWERAVAVAQVSAPRPSQ